MPWYGGRPEDRPALAQEVEALRPASVVLLGDSFHDAASVGRMAPGDRARLEHWVGEAGWETVLNRAGTTFRKLPDADKTGLDAQKAIGLMLPRDAV